MQAQDVNHELLQYCRVAATAARKCEANRISEDEFGHLLQLQIRLARIMVEEAMQQVGAKVGTAAFIDLVDFPGSIVHMYAGSATADGAVDRVLQTLERALAKDVVGVMIRKLLGIISFDMVLAACLKCHIDAGLMAVLPRTLHAVQLLAAIGGDLSRRFAAADSGIVTTLLGLLESEQQQSPNDAHAAVLSGADANAVDGGAGPAEDPEAAGGEAHTAVAATTTSQKVGATSNRQNGLEPRPNHRPHDPDAPSSRASGDAGPADPGERPPTRREQVMHRSAAALINLALIAPELREQLSTAPAMQATVAEFFASRRDATRMVALVYVSTLACTSEKRKANLLENGVAAAVVQCLDPGCATGIRLKALLALRNLVCGSKSRQIALLGVAPETMPRLKALSKVRTLKETFFEREDVQELEVRKEALILHKMLERVAAQQPQIDILKSELTTLRAKAMVWAMDNHRRQTAEAAADGNGRPHDCDSDHDDAISTPSPTAVPIRAHSAPRAPRPFSWAWESGGSRPASTGADSKRHSLRLSPSARRRRTPESTLSELGPDFEGTPSKHASNLMELAECSIEEAATVSPDPTEEKVHRMTSPRRRLLDDPADPETPSPLAENRDPQLTLVGVDDDFLSTKRVVEQHTPPPQLI